MLKFRPHHFLCTLGFEGKGYSEPFVANFQGIADRLRLDPAGEQIQIEVAPATDAICAPCPNRMDDRCTTEKKIQALDQAHAKTLGLKTGMVLTWGEAKKRIVENMTDQAFESACAPCSWKALGICKAALVSLRNSALSKK